MNTKTFQSIPRSFQTQKSQPQPKKRSADQEKKQAAGEAAFLAANERLTLSRNPKNQKRTSSTYGNAGHAARDRMLKLVESKR